VWGVGDTVPVAVGTAVGVGVGADIGCDVGVGFGTESEDIVSIGHISLWSIQRLVSSSMTAHSASYTLT
jgi:hypothetical protein